MSAAAPLAVVLAACILNTWRHYDIGFNYGDEGFAILISEQMLKGQILYRDLLGYNPFWHLSIEAVFAVFGVSLRTFRLFHLALAAVAAVFGYLTVVRMSGNRWLGALAGVLLGLFPGPIYKTFIPMLVMVNLYALSRLDLEQPDLRPSALIFPSAAVAVTLMTRSDQGWIFLVILNAILVSYTLFPQPEFRPRVRRYLAYLGVQAATIGLIFLPVFMWAAVYGILPDVIDGLGGLLITVVRGIMVNYGLVAQTDAEAALVNTDLVMRPPGLSDMLRGGADGLYAAVLFGHILIVTLSAVLTSIAIAVMTIRRSARLTNNGARTWAIWISAAGALGSSVIFRPDYEHFQQYLPHGNVVMLAACGLLLAGLSRRRPLSLWLLRAVSLLVIGILIMGSVRLAVLKLPVPLTTPKSALERFSSPDGRVQFLALPGQYTFLLKVVDAVQANSPPGDPLMCLTYCAGVNVMADRPNLIPRLFVDNRTPAVEPEWERQTIARIETVRPRTIVFDNYAPNGATRTRVDMWADDLMDYLEAHYERRRIAGTIWDILVRRD